MPKLWPAISPRTLMRNYCFQLLLLSWNYLDLGQPLRNFSIGHSQRSNFQFDQHIPQLQYTSKSHNLLLRKVPSILISKFQLDKFNIPTNHSFFVKKCQIFKYLVNRTRKKHYMLNDSHESEPELDFSYKDNLYSIIYHNSRSRICKNKESLRYCVSPISRNSQLLRLNLTESGILIPFRGTTNISHSSTMISTNPALNFTTQTEIANSQLRQNVDNMLVKGCQHGRNSMETKFIMWQESHSSAPEHIQRIKSNTLLHDLCIRWPTHHSPMLFNSS